MMREHLSNPPSAEEVKKYIAALTAGVLPLGHHPRFLQPVDDKKCVLVDPFKPVIRASTREEYERGTQSVQALENFVLLGMIANPFDLGPDACRAMIEQSRTRDISLEDLFPKGSCHGVFYRVLQDKILRETMKMAAIAVAPVCPAAPVIAYLFDFALDLKDQYEMERLEIALKTSQDEVASLKAALKREKERQGNEGAQGKIEELERQLSEQEAESKNKKARLDRKIQTLLPLIKLRKDLTPEEIQRIGEQMAGSPEEMQMLLEHFSQLSSVRLDEVTRPAEVSLNFSEKMDVLKTWSGVLSQVVAIKNPEWGQKIQVLGNNSIDLITAAKQLLDLRKIVQAGGTVSAWAVAGPVGVIAAAGLAMVSAFHQEPDIKEIISKQLSQLGSVLLDFQKETHLRFDRLEQMLSVLCQGIMENFQQIHLKLDYISHQVEEHSRKMQKTLLEAFQFNLFHDIHIAYALPIALYREKMRHIASCAAWATFHAKSFSLTGSELPYRLQDSDDVIMELRNNPFDLRIGFLAKLLNEIPGLSFQLPTNVVSPLSWAYAVDAYMGLRNQLRDHIDAQQAYAESDQKALLLQIVDEGKKFLDLIEMIQKNRSIFEFLFKQYIAILDQLLRRENDIRQEFDVPVVIEALRDLNKYYMLLQAAISLGLNTSFLRDLTFRSYFSSDSGVPLRITSGDDFRVMMQQNEIENDRAIDWKNRILRNAKFHAQTLQTLTRSKIEAIQQGKASDPYLLVEFMLQRLNQFGQENYPDERRFTLREKQFAWPLLAQNIFRNEALYTIPYKFLQKDRGPIYLSLQAENGITFRSIDNEDILGTITLRGKLYDLAGRAILEVDEAGRKHCFEIIGELGEEQAIEVCVVDAITHIHEQDGYIYFVGRDSAGECVYELSKESDHAVRMKQPGSTRAQWHYVVLGGVLYGYSRDDRPRRPYYIFQLKSGEFRKITVASWIGVCNNRFFYAKSEPQQCHTGFFYKVCELYNGTAGVFFSLDHIKTSSISIQDNEITVSYSKPSRHGTTATGIERHRSQGIRRHVLGRQLYLIEGNEIKVEGRSVFIAPEGCTIQKIFPARHQTYVGIRTQEDRSVLYDIDKPTEPVFTSEPNVAIVGLAAAKRALPLNLVEGLVNAQDAFARRKAQLFSGDAAEQIRVVDELGTDEEKNRIYQEHEVHLLIKRLIATQSEANDPVVDHIIERFAQSADQRIAMALLAALMSEDASAQGRCYLLNALTQLLLAMINEAVVQQAQQRIYPSSFIHWKQVKEYLDSAESQSAELDAAIQRLSETIEKQNTSANQYLEGSEFDSAIVVWTILGVGYQSELSEAFYRKGALVERGRGFEAASKYYDQAVALGHSAAKKVKQEQLSSQFIREIQAGNVSAAARLIEENGFNVDEVMLNKNGISPLVLFISEDDLLAVQRLINFGADLEKRIAGKTALHYAIDRAIERGQLDVVEALLEAGADIDAEVTEGPGLRGKTPLVRLIEGGVQCRANEEGVSNLAKLVEKYFPDVDKYVEGKNLLHWAVKRRFASVTEALVKIGADVNAKISSGDDKGKTSFDLAISAERGGEELLKVLGFSSRFTLFRCRYPNAIPAMTTTAIIAGLCLFKQPLEGVVAQAKDMIFSCRE